MRNEVLEPHDLAGIISTVPSDCPIEIEIGCGNGHFITSYGQQRDQSLLIGIDLKRKRCMKSAKKAENHGLSHIHILCARAENIIYDLPESRIEIFHMYFPDPWPKNRHRRRRFFRSPQLRQLHRSLKSGGKIYFCTDFFDYYLQAKVLILLQPGMALDEAKPPPEISCSLFSQRFSTMGKKLYFASAVKI